MEPIITNKYEYVELRISTNLYSEPDNKGKQKLIRKNIPTKISIYLEDIQAHEEVFDNSGKILPKVCRIHHKTLGALVVKHPYTQITQLKNKTISTKTISIGFNNGSNKSR